MAKKVREQIRNSKIAAEHHIIPPKYQHPVAIAIIYLSLLLFFHSIIFDGKSYQSADSIASHSWETLSKDAQVEGIFPLWNPYIFCGMPGYASLSFAVLRTFDLTTFMWEQIVRKVLTFFFFDDGHRSGTWLLFYLVYGIGVYFFALQKLRNKSVAVIVSLMAMYATYVALFIMMAHMTKLAVLAWFPYVFLIVDKLREKFRLIWALVLIIVLRLLFEPTHVQFIFYIYLSLGLYLLFFFVHALLKKDNWRSVLESGATLVLASVFAFLMGADQYFSTLEYNPYSIRGTNPITQTSSLMPQTKTIEGGLDYDYATSWSFSPGEMMTFFVPSWYGFGPHPYQGPLSQNQKIKLNTYWGPQPFVDGPQYMGVIVVVLALVGLVKNRKEPFVQYMGITIIISLLIAFGKEFPFIYDLMYRYFPMFNKFRIPLMILILVQFFTPILAGYGIVSFLSERKKTMDPAQEKKWKYILRGLSLGIVLSLVGASVIKDIYSSFFPLQEIGKALSHSYGQLNPTVLGMIYDDVVSSVVTDILVGFILLTVVFGAFYYYQKERLKSTPLYILLVLAVVIDLWRVAWKPSEPRDQQENIQAMATPEFVKILQQDTTTFRVLKIQDGQPIYDNSLAYWRISNAYGYQGAKMRIFQDMADVAGMGNPLVWQLMNVKYLISNREESSPALTQIYNSQNTKVYGIRFWLPRVFFVNRYEVSDGLGTLNKIADKSFNPLDIAYLPESIKTKIDPPLLNAEATVVHYGIQDLEVRATATGNNLLFLSEAYYPKGWKAFIDGNETNILKVNYMFRGVVIPKGTHTLTMKFEPSSFNLGKEISLASNILVWGALLVSTYQIVLRRKKLKNTSENK
jgi:hypothetical protein